MPLNAGTRFSLTAGALVVAFLAGRWTSPSPANPEPQSGNGDQEHPWQTPMGAPFGAPLQLTLGPAPGVQPPVLAPTPARSELDDDIPDLQRDLWKVWGRPGVDNGLELSRLMIRVLSHPQSRAEFAKTMMTPLSQFSGELLEQDPGVNPTGRPLTESERAQMAQLVAESHANSLEAHLESKIELCQAVIDATLEGSAIEIPQDKEGRERAIREFEQEFGRVTNDQVWTQGPGATVGTGRRVVLTRNKHQRFFQLLDLSRREVSDLKAAARRILGH